MEVLPQLTGKSFRHVGASRAAIFSPA